MKSSIPGHEDVERIEQKLFESLSRDEPPARARRATAAALGLGTAFLSSATAGAQGAAVIAKAGPLLVKWVGLGTLAAAVSVSAIRYVSEPPPAESPKPVVTMPSAPRAAKAPSAILKTVAPEPPAAQAIVAPMLSAQAAPPLPSREARIAQRSSDSLAKPATVAAPAPSVTEPEIVIESRQLAAEVAMLDQARGALVTKDGERALDVLGRYARQFPAATLNLEATVLRIEALFLMGSTDSATSLGREFLAAHPASTHASRIRHLLAEHQKP
jgi:hypothetical protein